MDVPLKIRSARDAREQSETGDGGILSRYDIGQRDTSLHGRAIRLPGDRHPSGLCLDDEVVTGTRGPGAETGDGAPNQFPVLRRQVRDIESDTRHRARQEILDHDVGFAHKSRNQIPFTSQVSRDAELVAVHRQEIGCNARRIERRAPRSGLVTVSRSLDLDHVGAQVTEHHCAQRTGQDARQVNYSNAL